MKIFVIHSGVDRKTVEQKVRMLGNTTANSEFLMLKNGGRLWKHDAKIMIKRAQMVLLFVGKASYESKNISWEIITAIKYGKPIHTILLDKDNQLPKALMIENSFTKEQQNYSQIDTIDDVSDYINEYLQGDYGLFNYSSDKINKTELLEQYKIFLQTSETLVERRQNVNNFYITVNSALITVFSIISAFEFGVFAKCLIGFIFSIVGIVLCVSWIRILNSYGILNASKMRVISIIEKQLPASLYDAEWRAQSDKLNRRPYVSFTYSESRIPRLFIVVYVIAIASALVIPVLKLCQLF